MDQHQLTENLTQLTRMKFVNAYLVREDDGFTLVDTTVGGGADDLLKAAAAAGGEIRRIALTHGHSDHTGSLDALKEKLGGDVEVLMPEIDARVLAGEKTIEGRKAKGTWPKLKTTVDTLLREGDRVGSLEVVASPGHSPGHVAFLESRDRSLIAGDAFATIGGLSPTSEVNWRFPLPVLAAWDRNRARASARKLADLKPTLLVVGHGGAVRDPAAEMDRVVSRAEA